MAGWAQSLPHAKIAENYAAMVIALLQNARKKQISVHKLADLFERDNIGVVQVLYDLYFGCRLSSICMQRLANRGNALDLLSIIMKN